MISRRRAAARPRLVRRNARALRPAAARRVKRTLSPTKRKRRSPGAGIMAGPGRFTKNSYHEAVRAERKSRNSLLSPYFRLICGRERTILAAKLLFRQAKIL